MEIGHANGCNQTEFFSIILKHCFHIYILTTYQKYLFLFRVGMDLARETDRDKEVALRPVSSEFRGTRAIQNKFLSSYGRLYEK